MAPLHLTTFSFGIIHALLRLSHDAVLLEQGPESALAAAIAVGAALLEDV